MQDIRTIDGILIQAISLVQAGRRASFERLDTLPLPLYATDAEGVLTYYNAACIAFAGRTPSIRVDRWCITWKLYTEDGDFLPHAQCPMAVALRGEYPIRGESAIAERPDGGRRNFMPFPTPFFDDDGGTVTGAINLFLDITERKQAAHLFEQADRCRRWVRSISDRRMAQKLMHLIAEYEDEAYRLESESAASPQARYLANLH